MDENLKFCQNARTKRCAKCEFRCTLYCALFKLYCFSRAIMTLKRFANLYAFWLSSPMLIVIVGLDKEFTLTYIVYLWVVVVWLVAFVSIFFFAVAAPATAPNPPVSTQPTTVRPIILPVEVFALPVEVVIVSLVASSTSENPRISKNLYSLPNNTFWNLQKQTGWMILLDSTAKKHMLNKNRNYPLTIEILIHISVFVQQEVFFVLLLFDSCGYVLH